MTDRRIEPLRLLLRAYEPTAEEAVAHQEMLDLLVVTPEPLSRVQFDPGHFTVGGFVLPPGRSDVLLVLHRRLTTWLEPGGHVDPTDDDLRGAALREVTEETGLEMLTPLGNGILDVDVHPIPVSAEPAHRHYNVCFIYEAADTALAASPEVADAAWVPLDQVHHRTSDSAILRAVAKLAALS